jgi:hypothetical protein
LELDISSKASCTSARDRSRCVRVCEPISIPGRRARSLGAAVVEGDGAPTPWGTHERWTHEHSGAMMHLLTGHCNDAPSPRAVAAVA